MLTKLAFPKDMGMTLSQLVEEEWGRKMARARVMQMVCREYIVLSCC